MLTLLIHNHKSNSLSLETPLNALQFRNSGTRPARPQVSKHMRRTRNSRVLQKNPATARGVVAGMVAQQVLRHASVQSEALHGELEKAHAAVVGPHRS